MSELTSACHTPDGTPVETIRRVPLPERYTTALSRFLHDPDAFRSILRDTSSIVSGSVALHVLDTRRAQHWTPTDLDIYVPQDAAVPMVAYLRASEGYTELRADHSKYGFYRSSGMRRVIHLRRDDVEIDVIESSTPSALSPLPNFWSTHVMNYLTADTFCIAYPDLTLQGKSLLNPIQLIDFQYPTPRTIGALYKYEGRGYDVRSRPLSWACDPKQHCDRGAGCPRTIRYFGDRFCVAGPLSADILPPPVNACPDKTLTVVWSRGGTACGGTCVYPPDVPAQPLCDVVTLEFAKACM